MPSESILQLSANFGGAQKPLGESNELFRYSLRAELPSDAAEQIGQSGLQPLGRSFDVHE